MKGSSVTLRPPSHPQIESAKNEFNCKATFGFSAPSPAALLLPPVSRASSRTPLHPERFLISSAGALVAISLPSCLNHLSFERMASQRSQVFQAFKLSGLTLEASAARYLLDVFKSHTPEQLQVALDAVLRCVKSLVLSSSIVPLSAIQEASKALENSYFGDEIDDVKLISAAECPHLECAPSFVIAAAGADDENDDNASPSKRCSLLPCIFIALRNSCCRYDGRRKSFIKALATHSNILTGATLRSHALQRRFAVIQQLVQRCAPPLPPSACASPGG